MKLFPLIPLVFEDKIISELIFLACPCTCPFGHKTPVLNYPEMSRTQEHACERGFYTLHAQRPHYKETRRLRDNVLPSSGLCDGLARHSHLCSPAVPLPLRGHPCSPRGVLLPTLAEAASGLVVIYSTKGGNVSKSGTHE